MTKKQLQREAYRIATSNSLTEEFTYSEFQKINSTKYAWEPFEYWPEKDLDAHIAQIAEDIIRKFSHLTKGN